MRTPPPDRKLNGDRCSFPVLTFKLHTAAMIINNLVTNHKP